MAGDGGVNDTLTRVAPALTAVICVGGLPTGAKFVVIPTEVPPWLETPPTAEIVCHEFKLPTCFGLE